VAQESRELVRPIPLEIPPRFKRQLGKKTPELQDAILQCVEKLGENSRRPSLRTHELQSCKGVFEAYVDKANRITFHYERRQGQRHIVLRKHCDHDILRKP